MRHSLELAGQRFGKLVAIERIDNIGQARWLCKCDCGNTTTVRANHLVRGYTKSCGCYQKERARETHIRHGERKTRLYMIWADMKSRCLRESEPSYPNYGGRGISICKEWENSFEAFRDWAYENGYCQSLSIDRADNNGNYCPENCRWSTLKEQSNNRRNNVYVTVNGETHTLSEWSEIQNIPYTTIIQRRRRGWSDEDSVSIPLKGNHVKR